MADSGARVLPFPGGATPSATPPSPTNPRDDLAQAIAALQAVLQAELALPPAARGRPHAESEDVFTPIGIPRGPAQAGRAGVAQPQRGAGAGARPDALARRILCLWFPDFPIERWMREADRRGDPVPDDLALALAREGPHGPVVHAVNRAARLAGVAPGARIVDARALAPGLTVIPADPGGDMAALQRLARWCRRFCPWTAVEGTRGILMDTTGSDHLWGGEAALMEAVEGRLSMLGLTARLALAPTPGAAWALARHGAVRDICTTADLPARMGPLPVRTLRLDPDTVQTLDRLGLKRVADLAAVPRLSLARRFPGRDPAQNPLLRLDQMLGQTAEPLSAPDDPALFAVQVALAEPILDPTAHLPGLAADLCEALGRAGQGARRLRLTLYRTDGEVVGAEVATARASRDPRHLVRLFDGRLDRVDPGFGFDLITLEATLAEGLDAHQRRLDGGADDGAEMAALVDRLTARFGAGALRHPGDQGSHIPERSVRWAPAMAGRPTAPTPLRADRPMRLFDPAEEITVIYAVPEGPPAQFTWRRVTHRVTRFAGPERIAPEWWADRPGARLRDYYRIEDQDGRRLWIYRDGVQDDGRGAVPRWFVQGVFG